MILTRVLGNATEYELTASWLTELLRAEGQLESGEVRSLSAELLIDKSFSRLYRLRASYTPGVSLPRRFVLKLSRASAHSEVARRRRWKEYEFYTHVAPVMDNPPIARAFAAAFDSASLVSMLLLEDLSDSHARPPTPLPSTALDVRSNVDCLAAIHGWWWGHADLIDVTLNRDAKWVQSRTARMRKNVTRFLEEFATDLPAAIRAALESVYSAYDTLLQRSAVMPLTIVHGDAHPWNFLLPIDPHVKPAVLLDWEGWSIEPGPHDLTSLLALHLPIETRTTIEDEALEQYVRRLQVFGVSDYDLRACRNDYRRSVARRVFSPVAMWARGSASQTWRPMLDRIASAFHQLRCEEILSESD